MLIVAEGILLLAPDCDNCWYSAVPWVLLGLCYTTYSVIQWATVTLLVDPKTLGSAYGILTVL